MTVFAVQLRFRPENNERRLEVRPEHREYLASLREQGKLLTAGPWADDTGALLLYDVADEAELQKILADDPYTPVNAADADIHEWRPLFPFS
jgi:uncharacterized protein